MTRTLTYDDDELREMVRKLNGLFPERSPWRTIKARKGHRDLLGDVIQNGDIYYGRQVGGGVIRLTRASMDAFLVALFVSNRGLRETAEQTVQLRFERLAQAHQRCSPVARWFGDE